MALLKKFLCYDLQTGSIIIGWVGGIWNFLLLVVTSIILSEITPLDQYHRYDNLGWRIGLEICIAMSVVEFITQCLLLYGTYKRKKMLLIPYLISLGFKIVCTIITVLGVTVWIMVVNSVGFGVLLFFFGLWFNGIIVYVWICVLSLYKVLQEEQRIPVLTSDDCT